MKELGHLEREQRGRRQKALTSMPVRDPPLSVCQLLSSLFFAD